MKLEWMGDYREIIEKLMRYCNIYASVYNKEMHHGTEIPFSYAQVQVLEYLLENEELNQNMSEIAGRLGISLSSFSKLANRLVKKGLLEKFHRKGNKKDIIVKVTPLGRDIYERYSVYILENHFSKMFAPADAIPREYLPLIAEMLDAGRSKEAAKAKEQDSTVLIPVEKQ